MRRKEQRTRRRKRTPSSRDYRDEAETEPTQEEEMVEVEEETRPNGTMVAELCLRYLRGFPVRFSVVRRLSPEEYYPVREWR